MTSQEKIVPIYHPPLVFKMPCYSQDSIFSREVSAEERAKAKEKSRCDLLEMSESALKNYNKKHCTNFELVETLTSKTMMRDSFWTHFNFKAKDKSASDKGSPVKLFFGEERYAFGKGKYQITTCRIVDGDKQGAECANCKLAVRPIIHPSSGFKMGLLERNIQRLQSLRPRPPKRQRN